MSSKLDDDDDGFTAKRTEGPLLLELPEPVRGS
jgi:hypothetical protein